jgi:hypothetical protein
MDYLDQSYQPFFGHTLHHYPSLPSHHLPSHESIYSDLHHQLHSYSGEDSPIMAMPNPHHKNETKPRLGKAEVDILEASFQENPKPSAQVKRQFAENMQVEVNRINNWFQNRRAKRKQEIKHDMHQRKDGAAAALASEPTTPECSPSALSANQTQFSDRTPFASPSVMPPRYDDPVAASVQSLERTMASVASSYNDELAHDNSAANLSHDDHAPFPSSDNSYLVPQQNDLGLDNYFSQQRTIEEPLYYPVSAPPMQSQMVVSGQWSNAVDNKTPEENSFLNSYEIVSPSAPSDLPPAPSSGMLARRPPPTTNLYERRKGGNFARIHPIKRSASQGVLRAQASPGIPHGPSTGVMNGRITKQSIESAQRSPFTPAFRNDALLLGAAIGAPTLTSNSSFSTAGAPPTPCSPQTAEGSQAKYDASPKFVEGTWHDGLPVNDGSSPFNMTESSIYASPPTPITPYQNENSLQFTNWNSEITDDQAQNAFNHDSFHLFLASEPSTPAFPSNNNVQNFFGGHSQPATPAFPTQSNVQHFFGPQSQPITPAFPSSDNMLGAHLLPSYSHQGQATEYDFGETDYTLQSEQQEQKPKLYMFNNSTAADFNSN